MADRVKIDGLRELRSSLKKFEKDVAKAPQDINKEAAKIVATAAQDIAPRRSGRLAGSIKPGSSGLTGYVQSRLIYAPVIHFGWPRHSISPNPFLYNALDARRDEVINLYEKRIQELADKVKGA